MAPARKNDSSLRRKTISACLREARLEKHLTKAEVARRSHIPYTTYDSYERGDREPYHDTLRIIARSLETEWWRLLGFDSFEEWALDNSDRAIIRTDKAKAKRDSIEIAEMQTNLQWDSLLEAYSNLNDKGKAEAVKRVQELTEIPRYRKQDSETPSDGAEGR